MFEFIVFGEDWGRHPSSTQHLFHHISQLYPVIWVNSVGMRSPSLSATDIKRVGEKVLDMCRFDSEQAEQEQHYFTQKLAPKVLPWHNQPWVNSLNTWLMHHQLLLQPANKEVKRVYWLSLPTAFSLIEPEKDDLVIYYCGDDFSALAGVDHKMVAQWEAKLVERADLIISASEVLNNKFPPTKSFLSTHGVNYDLFATPAEIDPRLADIKTLGQPVVGFYGSISSWLDVELIQHCIQQRPNYQFVFVGTPCIDISGLAQFNNCHFIPAVAHQQLPGFSQHWDVSILPFALNAQIPACTPLNLVEYLAAKTPIVTTRYPAAEALAEHVYIADGERHFAVQLDSAINNTAATNVSFALWLQTQSWSNKAEQIIFQMMRKFTTAQV